MTSISCALRMLQPPPSPSVTQEPELPVKVAILPFVNKTPNPEAGMIVRKMFYNFFSSLNYRDIEPFVIDDNLKINHLYADVIAGKHVSPQKLGQLLGVDAVIFGEVLSLGKTFVLVYSDNQAGLRAQLVWCKSAKSIWELEHTVHLEEGDVPISPLGLAATIFKTAFNHSKATHLQAAAALCMQMVATVPNPPGVTESPPKIQALVHNGADNLLQPGDYFKVAMVGDAGQEASCSIPPLITNLPLREKQPGIYIGSYRIKTKDRLPNGRLVGYLRSKSGVASQWMDTLGPIKIGKPTVLPYVISEDLTLNTEKSPYLVNEALLVKSGAKLTLNAGTVIWFRSLGLIVKGELQILGTRDDPVYLASQGTDGWKGIFLDRSQSQNQIVYCTVSDAEFGFRASHSTVSIQNSRFQDNVWGIVMEESKADISSSLIRTSQKSGIAVRKTRLKVKDSVITENISGGFILESSQVRIEQNNISNNGGWGIKVLDDSGHVEAVKNWWGNENPAENQIIGSVNFRPALKEPIEFGSRE
jgi:parallel beta-helix repeat protein